MKKKYITLVEGFIRYKNGFELNWSLFDWALPLNIDLSTKKIIFIRFLCLSFIIPTNIWKQF